MREQEFTMPNLQDIGHREVLATACWYMWWERRKIVHDEKVQKPSRSAQTIAAIALNYYSRRRTEGGRDRAGSVREKGTSNLILMHLSWRIHRLVVGAVIRDDRGCFIAGQCCHIDNISDAAMAEARALRDGLLIAGQIGCTKLEVNSDCSEVIEVMQDGGNSLGPAAAIYEE
jgi:hypothetical protein